MNKKGCQSYKCKQTTQLPPNPNTRLCSCPLPPLKDPSFATEPAAKHAPSTSPPNHSLALTPFCPTQSPLSLTANPSTWCINFNIGSVILFTFVKSSDALKMHEWALSTCATVNFSLLVPIRTKYYQLFFEECWSISIIQKFPDAASDLVHHQFEMGYQLPSIQTVSWHKHPLKQTQLPP